MARYEGRVVFVRHALPGERVVALVTEDGGGSYCRADAVEIRTPSPDRVEPPCPHAGPGRCGGCDWQHASTAAQRRLKAAVVREQLARLAGLPDLPVPVEPLPVAGAPDGLLGWRTRVRFAVAPDGTVGLRRHRSHEVEPVRECPLGTPEVAAAGVGERRWPAAAEVAVVASSGGDRVILVQPSHGGRPVREAGPPTVREEAAGRRWEVSAGGFWQAHVAAADTLARCVLDLLAPRPGETVLDLYAGSGLFAGVLAAALGPSGHVIAIEAAPAAARDAVANLRPAPAPGVAASATAVPAAASAVPVSATAVPATASAVPAATSAGSASAPPAVAVAGAASAAPATVRAAPVTPELLAALERRPNLVVLDPPRAGAGRAVMRAVLDLAPRAVAYVACDPASFARDLRVALDAGYRLAQFRAFDCFPMTAHVETVALLVPATPESAAAGA